MNPILFAITMFKNYKIILSTVLVLLPVTAVSSQETGGFLFHFDVSYDAVPQAEGIRTASVNCCAGKWLSPGFALAARVGGFSNFESHTSGPEVFAEFRFRFTRPKTSPFINILSGWAFQIPVTRIDTQGYFAKDCIALCRSRDGLSLQLKAGTAIRFGDHWFTVHIEGGLSQYYCGKWGTDPATGKTWRYGVTGNYPDIGEVWIKGQVTFLEKFKPHIGLGVGFDL